MGCQSEVDIGDNLTFSVCTHDPDTGVLTDADAVPDYRVYEDETGTAILTGSMAKLDDANTVGFYTELIACTAANGFEDGKSYTIYIEATVDSDTGGICYGFRAMTSVWSASSRTLTQSAAQVAAAVSGSDIAVNSYSTWTIALTDVGDISDRTELYFTAKRDPEDDADSASIVQVEETAGLLYINGASPSLAANGSITVTDAADGDLTIVVEADETGIPRQTGQYSVKMVTATDVQYMCEGSFKVDAVPGRAIT